MIKKERLNRSPVAASIFGNDTPKHGPKIIVIVFSMAHITCDTSFMQKFSVPAAYARGISCQYRPKKIHSYMRVFLSKDQINCHC